MELNGAVIICIGSENSYGRFGRVYCVYVNQLLSADNTMHYNAMLFTQNICPPMQRKCYASLPDP